MGRGSGVIAYLGHSIQAFPGAFRGLQISPGQLWHGPALSTLCQPPGHRPPLTGERVSNMAELPFNEYRECISVQTDKGTEVATNLVIVCNGIKINSFAYHRAFGKQVAEPLSTPQVASSLPSVQGPSGLSPRNWHSLPFLSIPVALLSHRNGDVKF